MAFSCKGRGFCPRFGWPPLFPDVPARQRVWSLPHRLGYLLAWDHDLCRAVVAVSLRAVLGFRRRRARRDGVADGRSGALDLSRVL